MTSLVTTQWLAAELGSPGLVVLDASAHLPMAGRDAAAEFAESHIPGARFLDLKNLVDPDSDIMSALPTRGQFAQHMAKLGVRDTDQVVLYDNSAMRTAARAWFICRFYGMHRLALLDGGFQKWQAEDRVTQSGVPNMAPAPFSANSGEGQVRDKSGVLANLKSKSAQLVDARDNPRFTGEEPDFRPEVASGHIPGSFNVPFDHVLNADGTFKDEAGLRAAFTDAGVDLDRPIIASCGSGVTASVLLFALDRLGKTDVALYDGSWSDWGTDPDTPKETGPGAAGAAA
ncbi:3-mercaptopyruvate sulfurtransferase [Aurantiacibacter poecillastricola]|uniref:3-mercaptopyruvate sulfurtransferase n=1 Tax=Aurantiacibacter poecillastricola TaxID=3064385 RepID=UPI00273E26C6|nr:3-mercaptopyruvate sulfurtransferase [Aurantiacibacter sp. 219JJ12-13]MDP5262908.1 3-mercaptopyruvate sulfurtransferase [Aurantiacibacter sp. 219JJ12-13]